MFCSGLTSCEERKRNVALYIIEGTGSGGSKMDISKMLQETYAEGIIEGIQLMKRRMEIAAETNMPYSHKQ